MAPLTGNIAHLGKDNENGARLAVEEINAKGVMIDGKKLKIELVGEDDQADPKTGTVVAQKLVDAKVNGVIGHLNSGTTIPASKIYADAGIPQISPSATNPSYTQQGFKTAFRVMANDVQQGKVLGEFAVKKLGAKTVAIIDDRTAYGQGLADEVEKAAKDAGAKIVAREFTKNDATDFKAILTKIKGRKPDAVFYGGMDAQAGPMAKQMKQLGIKAKLMSGDGGCTPEFIKLAGDAAEGFYCSQAGLPLDRMTRQGLRRALQEALQRRGADLFALQLRRGRRAGRCHEARQLGRSGEVHRRAAEDLLPGRHGQDRVRRQGRHQERRHHHVRDQGRQAERARRGRWRGAGAGCAAGGRRGKAADAPKAEAPKADAAKK